MKPTLVVMAAGMGSRYGGLKQIDSVGPAGERIIDYSIYDAIQAGFGKIVFIIRRDIERAFRDAMEPAVAGRIPVQYVFQELNAVPPGFHVPETRSKPWGTGHALLCCRDAVNEPFGVINADDFYGRDSYMKLVEGLRARPSVDRSYVLVGYQLINTLSPHGSVSRGVCHVTRDGWLKGMEEKTKLTLDGEGIWSEEGERRVLLTPETVVSMNMWGFGPGVFDALEQAFAQFLVQRGGDPRAEFFIPSVMDAMIRDGKAEVNVVRTASRWLGLTYPDDREAVRSGLASLIEAGEYPSPLW